MITSSRMPYISNEKYLELAKLDFNHVQSIHQKDLGDLRRCYLLYFCIQASFISSLCSLLKANISCIVQRWWKASGFTELTFTRDRVTEIYFSPASFMFEPEFATCRSVYTKTSNFTVILDDLYDMHGSLEDLKLFSEGVKR